MLADETEEHHSDSHFSLLHLKFKQDFVVRDVRRALFETISSFPGCLEDENDLLRLIETQFTALQEALRVVPGSGEDVDGKVAAKLINLYRTGRLGHYTLDSVPRNIIWLIAMKLLMFWRYQFCFLSYVSFAMISYY